jgi:MFS family permease
MGETKQPTEATETPKRWHARLWARMHRGDSVGWLICTLLQGLLTWFFMGLSSLAEGWAWEPHTKALVLVAIVATWVMALRAIRERIVELLRFWRSARKGPAEAVDKEEEERRAAKRWAAIRSSMFRLRIIAAGITMPFFILPVFVSAVCVGMCLWKGELNEQFLGMAMVLSTLAAIVGAYFHWAVVPLTSATNTKRPLRPRQPKVLQESRVE